MTIERLPSGVPTVQSWVSALRNGGFDQGEGYLRDQDNRFCCLGVLCNITDPLAWIPEFEGTDDAGVTCQTPFTYGAYGDQLIEGALATVVANEIGLTHEAQETLAEMNDCNRDFSTIADAIERSTVEGKIVPEILGEIWTEMQHPDNRIP